MAFNGVLIKAASGLTAALLHAAFVYGLVLAQPDPYRGVRAVAWIAGAAAKPQAGLCSARRTILPDKRLVQC